MRTAVPALAVALGLAAAGPACAQNEQSNKKATAAERLYDLSCYQSAVKVLTERFVGPPKIELYGNFIVFSGPTQKGPAVVIASERSICAYEDKH